jgi:hypothetical protein
MPKIAFFVGAASAGVGGIGVLLAWDRHDSGPDAADDLDHSGVGLYSFVFLTTGSVLAKLKTKSPISIPEANCPEFPDGFPDRDFFNRFEVKPGGTALTTVGNVSFEDSTSIYSAGALKFEVADHSVLSGEVSVQDRPTLQAWEDTLEGFAALINFNLPAKELWRALMTPNQPLEFF